MFLPNYPLLLFVGVFMLLYLAARVGARVSRWRPLDESVRREFDVIRAATLTLLGLIIGFSFSMAVNRYDQRKNLEQAEMSAISTEYLRTELLPAANVAKLREQLREYLDLRIKAYRTRDGRSWREIQASSAELEQSLWSVVRAATTADPNPAMALAASGMNDVFNSAADSTAARRNRIPSPAWHLMTLIAVCSCVLIGYGACDTREARSLLAILPFVVAISFLLIADIDAPWGGVIRIQPENLQRLSELLKAP